MIYIWALLILIPAAIIVRITVDSPSAVFVLSALGLVPLSAGLAIATEQLSKRTSNWLGALANATLGNATELIISIAALWAGKVGLVKASLTGSILGNLLLILGLSAIVGGFKNGVQHFDRSRAGTSSSMMLLSVAGLVFPTLLALIHEANAGARYTVHVSDKRLSDFSLGVSVALVSLYILSFFHRALTSPATPTTAQKDDAEWSLKRAIVILVAATVGIAILSEFLVSTVEPVMRSWQISELAMGVVIIPIIGNVAEHIVAVQQAYKNNMDLSVSVSLASSMQIALFVAPVLVVISLLLGVNLNLFFNPFEVVALGVAVHTISQISSDGQLNWFEGVQLVLLYVIIALGFFFL